MNGLGRRQPPLAALALRWAGLLAERYAVARKSRRRLTAGLQDWVWLRFARRMPPAATHIWNVVHNTWSSTVVQAPQDERRGQVAPPDRNATDRPSSARSRVHSPELVRGLPPTSAGGRPTTKSARGWSRPATPAATMLVKTFVTTLGLQPTPGRPLAEDTRAHEREADTLSRPGAAMSLPPASPGAPLRGLNAGGGPAPAVVEPVAALRLRAPASPPAAWAEVRAARTQEPVRHGTEVSARAMARATDPGSRARPPLERAASPLVPFMPLSLEPAIRAAGRLRARPRMPGLARRADTTPLGRALSQPATPAQALSAQPSPQRSVSETVTTSAFGPVQRERGDDDALRMPAHVARAVPQAITNAADLPLLRSRKPQPPLELTSVRTPARSDDPRRLSDQIRRQVEETVQRSVTERIERVLTQRLMHDAAPVRQLAERVQAELSESLVLERERLGWG